MELSEEHTHEHSDDLIEIRIPGWVLWVGGGILLGLVGVVAWDVYTQKRKTRELATELVTVSPIDRALYEKYNKPVLDMDKVEEWANKAGTNEQPESPAL